MLTTFYIVLSVSHYFLFDKFTFTNYEKLIESGKLEPIQIKFYKAMRILLKLNLIVCALLIILKILGFIEWW